MNARPATRFQGAKLQEARKAAGLSQSQFASRIGAHTTSVSDWERGRNEPSGRHVVSIARETDRSVEFFYGEADDEEESETVLRRAATALAGNGHYDLAADLLREVAKVSMLKDTVAPLSREARA